MALSMRHERQSVSLTDVSKSIISHAETILASLYDLQALSIRLHGEDRVQLDARQYREQLKAEWESTVKLFQKAQGFNSDVELLQDSIGTSSIQDVCEIITEMVSTARDAQAFASNMLPSQSLDAQTPYDRVFGESEQLDIQARRDEENERVVADTAATVSAKWSLLDTLDRRLPIPEQGLTKLKALQAAMLGMREAVGTVAHFWNNEVTFLSRTLQEALEGRLSMSQQDALEYATVWRNYDEQIGIDVNTLLKLSDAIIIEAKRPMADPPSPNVARQGALSRLNLPQISEETISNATKLAFTFGAVALSQVISQMGASWSQPQPQAFSASSNAYSEPLVRGRGYRSMPTRTLSASAPTELPPQYQPTRPTIVPTRTSMPIWNTPMYRVVNPPTQSTPFPYAPYVPRSRTPYYRRSEL